MKRDRSTTEYAPSFNISGVDLVVKQLEPQNLNFYVLHLKERTKLPESTFLVIDGKKRVPLFLKRKFDTVVHYDYTYRVFETHTLRLESDYVLDIFLELDESNDFAPKFDMTLFWTRRFQTRFVSLPFFPPDLNLEQLALTVDLKTIPPKTSIALKQRGDVSGTKASTLMGFYVPTIEEDNTWSYDAPKVFTPAQKKRINMGAMNEETAILFYLCMFQNVSYKQIGWCRVPQPLPLNWGALPDGYIVDPNAVVPKEIQNWYPDLDPSQGVMEVKCTEKNLTFEPYFYPQVYMEMISANVMWCDLVRFAKHTTKTGNGKWKTEYNARVYRVFRHKPTEQLLILLLKYALNHKTELQKIVHEDERFVSFREFFTELAASEPCKMLTHNETFLDMIKEYDNYKKQIY